MDFDISISFYLLVYLIGLSNLLGTLLDSQNMKIALIFFTRSVIMSVCWCLVRSFNKVTLVECMLFNEGDHRG